MKYVITFIVGVYVGQKYRSIPPVEDCFHLLLKTINEKLELNIEKK